MTVLRPFPAFSTDKFSFKNNLFTVEVSTLTEGGKRDFVLGRVYDDACDEGFTMVSAKTGKEVVFAYDGQDEHGEETAGWRFVCVTPGFKNLKALIIND